jgi:hypothetical protein
MRVLALPDKPSRLAAELPSQSARWVIHLMTVDGGDAESLTSLDRPNGLGRTADYIALRASDNLFRFNDDYVMMPL